VVVHPEVVTLTGSPRRLSVIASPDGVAAPVPPAPAAPAPAAAAVRHILGSADVRPGEALPPAEAALLRRRELGSFLRNRRERMRPEQVGLPPMGRRRTPGLRREEVAQLAGVGVSWYTWLEQGRDINVSEQVLEAIARTLMLDRHETAHLFALAGRGVQAASAATGCVTPPLRAVLAQLVPFPASIVNARFDLLAYNEPYRRLITDLDATPADDRNLLWLAFTHPAWRSTLVDWEADASRLVALFRAAMAEHLAEGVWKCLLKRLQAASPEFRAVWARHEVLVPESKTKRIRNPRAGLLTFSYTQLWLDRTAGDFRLSTYVPADERTAQALDLLVGGD
jgi:transcriptional regulator with XRE-family HTH domain